MGVQTEELAGIEDEDRVVEAWWKPPTVSSSSSTGSAPNRPPYQRMLLSRSLTVTATCARAGNVVIEMPAGVERRFSRRYGCIDQNAYPGT